MVFNEDKMMLIFTISDFHYNVLYIVFGDSSLTEIYPIPPYTMVLITWYIVFVICCDVCDLINKNKIFWQ